MGALPTDTRRTKMMALLDWKRSLIEETESLIAEHDKLYAELTRDAADAREDGNLYVADALTGQADLCYRTATALEVLLSEF